jgi:hypothetical protein
VLGLTDEVLQDLPQGRSAPRRERTSACLVAIDPNMLNFAITTRPVDGLSSP